MIINSNRIESVILDWSDDQLIKLKFKWKKRWLITIKAFIVTPNKLR